MADERSEEIEQELEAELSAIDLQLFKFAEKAWRAGFEIWVTDPNGNDFKCYAPDCTDPEFTLVRR